MFYYKTLPIYSLVYVYNICSLGSSSVSVDTVFTFWTSWPQNLLISLRDTTFGSSWIPRILETLYPRRLRNDTLSQTLFKKEKCYAEGPAFA
jgi:hypothetical protein